MGYTHYWTPRKNYAITKETWEDFITEVKELVANLPKTSETAGGYYSDTPIVICGGTGNNYEYGPAKFDEKEVWFNGDGRWKRNLDHETFCITPTKDEWNFCKTARKPYDLLVCAVLIAAHNHLGYKVDSDGGLEDWLPAIEYYSTVVYGRPKAVMNFGKDLRAFVLPKFLYDESIEYKRQKALS